MHAADLQTLMWLEVLSYIVDIDNMSATRALKGKTLLENCLVENLLHLRTGGIVEARDVYFREDITVSKKYLTAFLKGQHGMYEKIPFLPRLVEYVVKEDVRSDTAHAVEAELPKVITANHKENSGQQWDAWVRGRDIVE